MKRQKYTKGRQTHGISTKNNDNQPQETPSENTQPQETPSENTKNKQNQNQQTIELLRGKADVLTKLDYDRNSSRTRSSVKLLKIFSKKLYVEGRI
jgi:hypothetical protein